MFTGIIESIGKVQSLERPQKRNEISLWVETPFSDCALGESIALNGVCLTVAEINRLPNGSSLKFYASPETLQVTALQQLAKDSSVNLERAMQMGGRFSGHWVQGHVDGTAKVAEISPQGEAYVLKLKMQPEQLRWVVPKGSICIDGISLTINAIAQDTVEFQIIPHTWRNTHLGTLLVGNLVNIEFDILVKTIDHLLGTVWKQRT